jgi:predicted MFS family arabinose efflux permease
MKPPGIPPGSLQPPSNRYKWLVVGMLWLVCFFNYADRQAIFSIFPLLQKDFGLNAVQLGLLGSAFAWVYGLSGPIAGIVVDRVRRKTAILGGLQFWSIVCAASALSRTFRQLFTFRAAEGLGEAVYYPASASLISDYHGKQTRSTALGILVTGVYVGTVGGSLWAGLMAERLGWRFSLEVLGIAGCGLGIALQFLLREIPRGSAEDDSANQTCSTWSQELSAIVRTPTAVTLMLAFVCSNFVALVLLTWMPAYLYGRFHLSLARAALTATCYPQLGSMCGAFFGGYLADRLYRTTVRGRMITQAIGVLAGAPFVVLCGLSTSLSITIGALVCWGFLKGMYDANIFASAFDVVRPAARGTVTGVMNCTGWMIGGGSAPVLIGLLSRHIGMGFSIALSATAYLIAGALLLVGMMKFLAHDLLLLGRGAGNRVPQLRSL